MSVARLEKLYRERMRSSLQTKLGIKNPMAVPKLAKIVLNVGVKGAVSDSKVLASVAESIKQISGQKPVVTRAKKSIASFKLREGMAIGVKVTLRRQMMYEFLDRLISIALPRVRDFEGLKRSFDSGGNYNLGIVDWVVFPELENEIAGRSLGLNVSIITTAQDAVGVEALLEEFNMPFRKKDS
ncbi:MAG: 50S ribosomal protein L5 [Candidatus Babeliales bacterium]